MDRLGEGLIKRESMGLPPATSCQFSGLSEQLSLMPPREFLWPYTIPQGPFDKPKEADQLDWVGEVTLAWAESAEAELAKGA